MSVLWIPDSHSDRLRPVSTVKVNQIHQFNPRTDWLLSKVVFIPSLVHTKCKLSHCLHCLIFQLVQFTFTKAKLKWTINCKQKLCAWKSCSSIGQTGWHVKRQIPHNFYCSLQNIMEHWQEIFMLVLIWSVLDLQTLNNMRMNFYSLCSWIFFTWRKKLRRAVTGRSCSATHLVCA